MFRLLYPEGSRRCIHEFFTPCMAFARLHEARHPHLIVTRRQSSLSLRTIRSLALADFVTALRRWGLPSRRPSATGLLARYPDGTFTRESV